MVKLINYITLAFTGYVSYDEVEKLLSVMGADYVILVEKQELGTYSQIERELEELKAWKKKVLGVIVVGVDAVP